MPKTKPLPPTKLQVVEDVLKLYASRRLLPDHITFLTDAEDHLFGSSAAVASSRPCHACALGGIFYAMFDGEETPWGTYSRLESMKEVFPLHELREIEAAFGGRAAYGVTERLDEIPEIRALARVEAAVAWNHEILRQAPNLRYEDYHLFHQLFLNMKAHDGTFDPTDTQLRETDP